jgi:hypothetical protein
MVSSQLSHQLYNKFIFQAKNCHKTFTGSEAEIVAAIQFVDRKDAANEDQLI